MSERLIANVLNRGWFDLSSQSLVETIRNRFGNDGVRASVLLPKVAGKNGFVLKVDGVPVLVIAEDFPMPLEELEPLHGKRHDPDGPLLRHRTHVMVSLMEIPDEHASKMRAALALAQVIAAVSELPGASAILWSFSQTLVPASQFRDLVTQWTAAPDDVPLLLFARIVTYQDGVEAGTPRFGMFGVGFRPFIGREIEFVPQARSLQEIAYAFELVAGWSMMKGLVFNDGDTCGASETEVIRVRYQDESEMIKAPVLMCAVERLDRNARTATQ